MWVRRGCVNPERLSLNDRTGRYYNLTLMSTVDLKSKTLKLDISRRWILVGGRSADSNTVFLKKTLTRTYLGTFFTSQ